MDRGKPKQSSLRRSVSTAYYALFHLLTSEAAQRTITGSGRQVLRATMRRAYEHTTMKAVCSEFAKADGSGGKYKSALCNQPVPPKLKDVAQAFIDLQQARHEADYDMSRAFLRSEAIAHIEQAEQAFTDWENCKRSVEAHTFLAAMLAHKGLSRG